MAATVDIGDFASSLVVTRCIGGVVDEPSEDAVYKVALVGDTGVGKSSLLSRAHRDEFSDTCPSTIGVEFATFTFRVALPGDGAPSKVVKLQMWDTAGQERFRAITSAYYRGAEAVIYVYSITQESSFAGIEKWDKECDENTSSNRVPPVKVLVANKCDQAHLRTVDSASLASKARQCQMLPLETSARDSINVDLLMVTLTRVLAQGLFTNAGCPGDAAKKDGGALRGRGVAIPEATRPKLHIVDPASDGTATKAGAGCTC